ncbi:hypothetical protein [Chlamydia felis Fe/C-56]|uniref:Uncharacterized protein n=1 Tax=Chlamydia felis (strain Fe/C-56) TaxID=264202 RepID=Q255Q1_CHLFF|nr:IncA family protein [Chlamydia felis]BAE80987.1 hypothetical protein [Chlamydia felis Fe/C-56]
MVCASLCCYLKSENSEKRCCNFSASRVRLVATIVSVMVSLLMLSGAITLAILFGAQLGILYSTVIIGLSVVIGILLITASLKCFTCLALVPQSPRISGQALRGCGEDMEAQHISVGALEDFDTIETALSSELLEYSQKDPAYQDLEDKLARVKENLAAAKIAFAIAAEECRRLENLCKDVEADASINSQYRESSLALWRACLEHVQALQAYECCLDQLSDMHQLNDSQRVAPQREKDVKIRIYTLENRLTLCGEEFDILCAESGLEHEKQGQQSDRKNGHQGQIENFSCLKEEKSHPPCDMDETRVTADEEIRDIDTSCTQHYSVFNTTNVEIADMVLEEEELLNTVIIVDEDIFMDANENLSELSD